MKKEIIHRETIIDKSTSNLNEMGVWSSFENFLVILTGFEANINGLRPPINLEGREHVGAVLISGTNFSNHVEYHINHI